MPTNSAFVPTGPGSHALFVDTSALFAHRYRRDSHHEEMTEFFRALSRNELPYRPLVTNRYVLDELVSLLVTTSGHDAAVRALDSLLESTAITVLPVTDSDFHHAVTEFTSYDDHEISLTDHTIAHQAAARDVEYILSYDTDFEALGFTVVPRNG